MKLLDLQRQVESHGIRSFTPREFQAFMGMKSKASQQLIYRFVKGGIISKLRNGHYSVTSNPPSEYSISNSIYQPSYISFESALSHHGIIPETVYEVTAATTKATREYNIRGTIYRYHRIKPSAYSGYGMTALGRDNILIADAEKALVDYLYFVNLGEKTLNDRLNSRHLSVGKIIKYSQLYKRRGFTEFVKNVIRG